MNPLRLTDPFGPITLGSLVVLMLAGCASSGGLPAPVENRSLTEARGQAPVFDAKNPDLRATPGRQEALTPGTAPVVAAQPPLAAADSAPSAAPDDTAGQVPDVESVPIQSGRIETSPIAADEGAGSAPLITMTPAPGSQPPVVTADPSVDATNATDRPANSGVGPAMPPVASRAPTSESLPQGSPNVAGSAGTPPPVAPEVAPAAANADRPFIWPAAGDVTQSFTDPKSMGIAIAGKAGDPVSAAADGRVIFSGLGPRGYGKLLIVEHDDDLLSVYGNNRALLVKEGQAVRQGQRIAELGSSGTDLPRLHFEIRRLGKPVDPISYLPPSAN